MSTGGRAGSYSVSAAAGIEPTKCAPSSEIWTASVPAAAASGATHRNSPSLTKVAGASPSVPKRQVSEPVGSKLAPRTTTARVVPPATGSSGGATAATVGSLEGSTYQRETALGPQLAPPSALTLTRAGPVARRGGAVQCSSWSDRHSAGTTAGGDDVKSSPAPKRQRSTGESSGLLCGGGGLKFSPITRTSVYVE